MAQKPKKLIVPDNGLKRHGGDLLRGAEYNNFILVKRAIEEEGISPDTQDEETGMTALHWCGANRNFEIGEYLLMCGADPHIADVFGRVPMDLAIKTGHQDLINLLFNKMYPMNLR